MTISEQVQLQTFGVFCFESERTTSNSEQVWPLVFYPRHPRSLCQFW